MAYGSKMLSVLRASQLFEATGTSRFIPAIQSKCGFSKEHFELTVGPVLCGFAEFVQQLPGSRGSDYDNPGGLLIQGLGVAHLALTLRRGQILPRGVAPEDIMRLEHRWTYAVFIAALMHDIGRHMADLRVTLYRDGASIGECWAPLSGVMASSNAISYSVAAASKVEREESLANKLPPSLFERLVPADALAWLSNDRKLLSELSAVLAGEHDCGTGAIQQLISRASARFSNRSLSQGPRVPLFSTRRDAEVHTGEAKDAAPSPCASNATELVSEEYLDDFEHETEEHAGTPGRGFNQPGDQKPELLAPVALPLSPTSQAAAPGKAAAPSDAAVRFMAWLQQGLAQGDLSFNEPGAMVHFVKEGMLLVSPRIFQRFASDHGDEDCRSPAMAAEVQKDPAMDIQREVLNAGWHVRNSNRSNILAYQVLRPGKAAGRMYGVLVMDPQRFVHPVPPANPHLEKAAVSADTHALSP